MKNLIFATILLSAVVGFNGCQKASTESLVAQQQTIKQISVEQAKQATDGKNVQFIDVRSAAEYEDGHAPKTINLPLDSLEQNLAKLDKSKPVYVICQTGRRSQKGAEILEKNGFKDLYNIEGGTSAWKSAGFAVEK